MAAGLRSDLEVLPPAAPAATAEWRLSAGLVGYEAAVAAMEARAAGRANSSGCSNIRRCTPPAPARAAPT